jgi:FMN phosphatase YigB (HAD superfamily)
MTLTLDVDSATPPSRSLSESDLTFTLLLDLDNTLLGNPMESFIPAYFKGLTECLRGFAPEEKVFSALVTASGKMMANTSPEHSLESIFNKSFYPAIGADIEDAWELLEVYYRDEYPRLQSVVDKRQEAITFVEEALARGYQVAVTTNPLFPAEAVHGRLEWAGLSPEKYPYELVSSFERFHFAKPNPAYYAEVLGYLGWPEGPVLVVGDDQVNDVDASASLGLKSFLVNDPPSGQNHQKGQYQAAGSGGLLDILPWIDLQKAEFFLPEIKGPVAVTAALTTTIPVVVDLSRQFPIDLETTRPAEDAWSFNEIIWHLRDVEEKVNIPRIQRIMAENNPFIPGIDTHAWIDQGAYKELPAFGVLEAFIRFRSELLADLSHLDESGWNQPARHAIFGPTSLLELATFMVGHDQLHIRQFNELLDYWQVKNQR